MDHDLTIVLNEHGMPIVTDVSNTVHAHRAILARMRDQADTLAALNPAHARSLVSIARGYDMLRTRLNTVEA